MICVAIGLTEKIIISVMVFLVVLFYTFSGINLIKGRNQASISKKYTFKNPEKFTLIIGLMEVINSSIVLILTVIGLILSELFLVFLLVCAGLILLEILLEIFLQQKFKERRIIRK